jgi:hypothetical protein
MLKLAARIQDATTNVEKELEMFWRCCRQPIASSGLLLFLASSYPLRELGA